MLKTVWNALDESGDITMLDRWINTSELEYLLIWGEKKT